MATLSLHTCTVEKTRIIINRIHNLFHFPALLAVLYYRILHLLLGDVPLITWGLITTAEVVFGFLWILSQAFEWWPVTRTTYPENIPVSDNELPGVDVFVCMADPKKEPILDIMNTVVSAMALDYPPEKLAVYLSDDSGTSATLCAIKEACSFARCWLPFCRKYGIKTRCPEAYFSRIGDDERVLWSDEFRAEEDEMKSKYKLFKQNVEKANGSDVVNDRPPCVEVIHDNRKDGMNNSDEAKIPLLVYVSREKRPSHPHRFKVGALNALLRISGIMSNGPYLLVLDCDMYCNDPTSARQSMCFHLDPKISPSIAFVQYPQMFYNLSKNDIYDNQSRSTYMLKWQGMDGIGGPYFTGSGYYLKRKALYGTPNHEDAFLREPEKNFGFSSKFISSLKGINQKHTNNEEYISDAIVDEARNLATCTFEKGTEWGQEVGYSYSSLLESTSTGYLLHCRGWRSVYLYPNRPCFLGCATIDMHDGLVQIMKWSSGLTQVAFSGFSPLTYGVSRMSLIQSMCYGFIMFSPLYSIPNWLYGTIPQMCLLSGIHLYPKVSSPWFIAFATVYVSSISQHLFEVFFTGGSMRTWWNEYRIRPIRSVTALFFGVLDVVMKRLGVVKANFRLTNKTIDKDKMEKYKRGKFDFQGADMFVVPLRILAILNLVCFIGGLKRVVFERNLEDLFVQVYISSMTLAISYPILEELIPKKGR